MKKDSIDELFEKVSPYLDLEEPQAGHKARFMAKLNANTDEQTRGVSWWKPLSIAASILLVVGLFLGPGLWNNIERERIADISPEISNSEFYFANILEQQVKQLESEKSPETNKIIEDALGQLAFLESDYEKLEQDLLNGGNHNIILRAMIQNFQTRIDLMQDVLEQIEIIKNLKNQQNENSIT